VSRSRKYRGWRPPRRREPGRTNPTVYHLDTFTIEDVRRWKRGQEEFVRVYWNYYNELAYQRSKKMPEIKAALLEASVEPYDFSEYQRAVRYRWTLDPLSVKGSLSDIGGRFNIGDIDRTKYPLFPALYIARDRATAIQELQQVNPEGAEGLSAEELALTETASITVVSVYGSIEPLIDLYQPERLNRFMDVIKGFKLSDGLIRDAKALGLEVGVSNDLSLLMRTLLDGEWRRFPMHVDVPSNSQIFGQLSVEAGVAGILYPSKYGEKECLSIYPQNFRNTDSFVQIADKAPVGIKRKRLDANSVKEIMGYCE